MKKRLLCMIRTLVMIFSLVPSVAAASDEATEAAEALYELGLFKGTGTNPDGTPIFDLDKTPTRNQAIIMLVRLLGKEEEALAGTWEIPFTDVSDAMRPYIGYKAPSWRLRVGDFRTRDEAEEMLKQLKKAFPAYSRELTIVVDRIN